MQAMKEKPISNKKKNPDKTYCRILFGMYMYVSFILRASRHTAILGY